MRLWSISGEPYDPDAAAERAARARRQLPRRRPRPPRATSRRATAAGDSACSRSTPSCSATGGRRGRSGSARWSAGAAGDGVRLLTLPQALARARARGAARRRVELGRGKEPRDLGLPGRWRTSPGPPGAPSCACCAQSADGRLTRDAALRAARELLALQSSDWAFMDHRGQAGDYPYARATAHAQGPARGHRLRRGGRRTRAQPRPRPQSGAAARALVNESRPDPLLGVPAADRGWPGPPRAQALRGPGRAATPRSMSSPAAERSPRPRS